MEAFQQFLQSRGIQRIRKQHRRLTDTIPVAELQVMEMSVLVL